jgi:hypothetical protein
MKKRRPPRPRRKRKAPVAMEGKRKVGDLSSSLPSGAGAVSDDAPPRMQADATVSRPATEAKTIELPDRVDTVAAMTNARGWGIFAGFIISYLLLASVVVFFATHWT